MFAKIGVPAKYRNVRSMRNNFPRGESEDTLWGIGRKRRAVRAAEQIASATGKDTSDSCNGGGMFAKIGVPAKYRNVRSMQIIFRGEKVRTLCGA